MTAPKGLQPARRLPISPALIDVLLALHAMQPATVRLIAVALNCNAGAVPRHLDRLLNLGLVTRRKVGRQMPLTLNEQLGFVPGQLRPGKRPYLYALTKSGSGVAAGLSIASKAFRE